MKRLAKEYINDHLKEFWGFSNKERKHILSAFVFSEKDVDLNDKIIILEYFSDSFIPSGYELYCYSEDNLIKLFNSCLKETCINYTYNLRVLDKNNKIYHVKATNFSLEEIQNKGS